MQPNPAFSGPVPRSDDTGFIPAQQPRSRRFRTFRVVTALIMRETGSRETRTSLGFLWTLIDPILAVAILSLTFSLIQRHPRLGTNFPLYYASGVIPFNMFSYIANRVSGSIRYSGNLLGFPSVTVIDVILSRFLLNVFTNLVVFVVVMWVIIGWYDLRIYPEFHHIAMSMTMAAALGLGVGTMNSVLFLLSSAYEKTWSVIMRPMSMFSGVMILITDLPSYIFDWLKWLPMAHFVSEMREAFYPSYQVSFVSPTYVFAISGVTFVIGMVGLQRHVFDLLERR